MTVFLVFVQENPSDLRCEVLSYLLFHKCNTAELPADLEAHFSGSMVGI